MLSSILVYWRYDIPVGFVILLMMLRCRRCLWFRIKAHFNAKNAHSAHYSCTRTGQWMIYNIHIQSLCQLIERVKERREQNRKSTKPDAWISVCVCLCRSSSSSNSMENRNFIAADFSILTHDCLTLCILHAFCLLCLGHTKLVYHIRLRWALQFPLLPLHACGWLADHFIKYRNENAMHLIAFLVVRVLCAFVCPGMEFIDASAYAIDPSIDRSVISFRWFIPPIDRLQLIDGNLSLSSQAINIIMQTKTSYETIYLH